MDAVMKPFDRRFTIIKKESNSLKQFKDSYIETIDYSNQMNGEYVCQKLM